MENPNNNNLSSIPISDLLQRRRPISGTASLRHHHPRPPTTPPPPSNHRKSLNSTTTTSTSSPSKTLTSLSTPSIIIGTLSLPLITNHSLSSSSSSNSPSHHSCFSFSDDSGSLCCDVLRFDIRMVKRKIRVLGWNFIPFKQCGGLLEIIDWEFVGDLDSGNADSFRLSFEDEVDSEKEKEAKYSIYGVLTSVSPVVFASNRNLSGFTMEFLYCECKLCKCKDYRMNFDSVGLARDVHSFRLINYVYCCGCSLSWYPVFLSLVGSVVLLEGLRKKLVYLGNTETQTMLVSSKITSLRVARLKENKDYVCRNGQARIKAKGELGMYVGVVRGIYMHGMVVELDEDVWLLRTDDKLPLPHSVRVGAILSVRNVHIVKTKFQWGKPLILGACCKTNISTISFSPLATRCHLVLRSVTCLGKFLESLVFPARLWVLLLLQCFRRKFAGVFSEREIIGTNHTEGVVQTYAGLILPSSAQHSRQGIFMEFCKHNICASGCNISYGSLNLAMPFSNLVNICGKICVKSLLQIRNGLKILDDCSKVGYPSQENISSDPTIRRILPSKGIGISLLGNLKICPTTGRLQYIDASGSIDAVIPDIPSTWDVNAIYEVCNYSLVVEGMPETWNHFWILEDDLLSCSSLFKNIAIERQAELIVYLHFSWSNVCRRHFSIHQGPSSIDSSAKLDPGTFHFFFVAHKFPLQQKFHGDLLLSGKSRFYAEIMVLPWDLNIAKSGSAAPAVKMLRDNLENDCQTGSPLKRCKLYQTSSCIDKVGLCNDLVESGKSSCGQPMKFVSLPHKTRSVHDSSDTSPVQVHCTVTGREMHGQCMDVPGILCYTEKNSNSEMLCSRSSRKVLLEFNSEGFCKYKLLQIGGGYILKHCAEKCFCDSHQINLGSSILIASELNIWSLSFHFSEAIDCTSGPCNDALPTSHATSENLNVQNELVLSPFSIADHGTFSDFILHVGPNVNGLLDDVVLGFQALKELVINLSRKLTDISNIGQQVSCENNVMGFLQSQVMYSGNVLPEGNLMSLRGTVISLRNLSCSIDSMPGNRVAHHVCQPKYNKQKEGSISILVLTNGHLVEICGCLSKLNCPVGFGPGAVVTFHRILAYSGQNCFILTPVSFITVNIVSEIPSPSVNLLFRNQEESVATCLISDLIHNYMCQPRMFHCSIVAVYFVMLERNKSLDKVLSHSHCETPVVRIPLAGFIVDDGSSHCCCWTNGDQAATFLRLHGEIPQAGSVSKWWKSKAAVKGRTISTPSNQLHRILKKHGKAIVKNYGSIHDILCQDLQLSAGTEDAFGSQDENLLKFIMLNACSSTLWNVIGHAMNFDAVNMLKKKLHEEQMPMHDLQNVWAKQVCQVNPLAQAKALLKDL